MLLYYCFLFQPGSDIVKAAVERSFLEPRLAIFGSDEDGYTNMQGFIFTEGRVVFEFSVPEALTALIACYYVFDVSYPKPPPASGLLLFIQELLMGMHEQQVKKSARYSSFVDSVMIPDL